MPRLNDWPRRLSAWMTKAVRLPEQVGAHDCVLFAAGAAEAQTGVDVAAGIRGYASYREGLRRLGVRRLRDAPGRFFQKIPTAKMQRGDIAYVVEEVSPGRKRAGLMVCDGLGLVGLGGVRRARSAAKLAWRVG